MRRSTAATSRWCLVDDGSTDSTANGIQGHAESDARIRPVYLTRNYGQTAAMEAGFDAATGDVLVPMDADLQNDPHDIPALLAKLDEGYDVVSGWRKDRQDKWSRVLPSRVANAVVS
ncbi:MAG: glycosyltransferase, partial [Candidatus Latescibacteria bacterium]|nr:glycosyltransferase [Candidatus Latescibacterota bacterium]